MLMSYKLRTRTCCVCGELTTGYYSPSKPVRCAECGIKVLEANSLAMYRKEGPGYERWLASNGPKGRPRK